jgi:hypothetical protein
MATWISSSPLTAVAFACAAASALLVLWWLVRRPALTHATKLLLLLGIGVLPIAMATTGNVAGYEATKARTFCGSCHVMTPYSADSHDPESVTLAARHARNAMFGDDNCYTCHADYGMFGTITTGRAVRAVPRRRGNPASRRRARARVSGLPRLRHRQGAHARRLHALPRSRPGRCIAGRCASRAGLQRLSPRARHADPRSEAVHHVPR